MHTAPYWLKNSATKSLENLDTAKPGAVLIIKNAKISCQGIPHSTGGYLTARRSTRKCAGQTDKNSYAQYRNKPFHLSDIPL